MRKITPFLWFDGQAEEAVKFYTSIFTNSKTGEVARYGDAGPGEQGSVMTIAFQLNGQDFIALNGGPEYKFTEAVSFFISCADQQEVDYYWEKLSDGGEKGPCGWLKDKFGLSWQVVPSILPSLIGDPDPLKAQRATSAMLKMGKLDIAALQAAHDGM